MSAEKDLGHVNEARGGGDIAPTFSLSPGDAVWQVDLSEP